MIADVTSFVPGTICSCSSRTLLDARGSDTVSNINDSGWQTEPGRTNISDSDLCQSGMSFLSTIINAEYCI